MITSGAKPVIGVIGAGSWGTALAILLARNGCSTYLWGNEPEVLRHIQTERVNRKYLPNISLPDNLDTVDSLAALSCCDEFLIAAPSHAFRDIIAQLQHALPNLKRLLYATKGFEPSSNKLLHQVVVECYAGDITYAVLSGPTFALEVAQGFPTAITVASPDEKFAIDVATWLHNDRFRAYTSTDVVGVEVGGAVKNVLAIGAGISDGLGFGANSRAALITRGLAEITRLGLALGADQETFMGLTGLGDLVLTCTDNQSRNRRFGIAIAQGKTQEQAKREIGQVIEGIQTAKVVHEIAGRLKIDMPIVRELYQVIYENANPAIAVQDLFLRELKPEFNSD